MTIFALEAVGGLDALEEAVKQSIEGEATWLETQHALLRRALLQLRAACADDAALTQAERTLQLVSAAIRDRLTSLDTAATVLRSD